MIDESSSFGKFGFRRRLQVPDELKQLSYLSEQELVDGKTRYENQKRDREKTSTCVEPTWDRKQEDTIIAQWILPDDCLKNGNAKGGKDFLAWSSFQPGDHRSDLEANG